MTSAGGDPTNTTQDGLDTLWKEYISSARRCVEEEVEAVATGGAVEWAELQLKEQQLHSNIAALLHNITSFKESSTRKVESLVESLTAAVSNART